MKENYQEIAQKTLDCLLDDSMSYEEKQEMRSMNFIQTLEYMASGTWIYDSNI